MSLPVFPVTIAKAQKKLADKLDITVERVVGELAKLGFSNMLDYTRKTDDGLLAVDMSKLTRDKAASISEITSETVRMPGGADHGVVVKTKIKLHDKLSALEKLGKHLGMFQTAGDSADNPIHVVPVSDAKRLAAVVLLIARAGLTGGGGSAAG